MSQDIDSVTSIVVCTPAKGVVCPISAMLKNGLQLLIDEEELDDDDDDDDEELAAITYIATVPLVTPDTSRYVSVICVVLYTTLPIEKSRRPSMNIMLRDDGGVLGFKSSKDMLYS